MITNKFDAKDLLKRKLMHEKVILADVKITFSRETESEGKKGWVFKVEKIEEYPGQPTALPTERTVFEDEQ